MRCLLAVLLLCTGAAARAAGVIALYHHVAEDTPASTSISPDDFRAHLRHLADNGFAVMRLEAMVDALRGGRALPERAAAITFDDGYVSIYETAFPMLREFGFPFTLFLSTAPVDRGQSGYLSWAQIREMAAAGMTVANHTREHPYMLSRRDGETRAEWLARRREDLLAAEAIIERETGQSHRFFAYPYGEYDPALKSLLEELGFTGFAQNSGAVGPRSDFLALPRFPLAGVYADLDTARVKFEALPFPARQLEPASPVTAERAPAAVLQFDPGDYSPDRIACFAGGEPMAMEWLDRSAGVLRMRSGREMDGRRWHYTCTAPQPGTGRFYWRSVQWIRP